MMARRQDDGTMENPRFPSEQGEDNPLYEFDPTMLIEFSTLDLVRAIAPRAPRYLVEESDDGE
jgi:hypothetical protein